MKPIDQLTRANIRNLKPYSSARDEYTGSEGIFLDANENPFNSPFNRYPDPRQRVLKARISELKNVDASNIFLGNGSDEPIDLLYRAFCEPGVDNVVSIDPTYGMYQVAADINNTPVKKVALENDFSLNPTKLLDATDHNTKLIWICSPNNPTGNCFEKEAIIELLNRFNGLVIVDEAYIDFAPEKSILPMLSDFPNLVVLQTFSKAWGLAGIRLGMAFASSEITGVLGKIKYPYNLNILTQKKALEFLESDVQAKEWVKLLLEQRDLLARKLKKFDFVEMIYPSDANFLLVKTINARRIYNFLVEKKLIIRDRSTVTLCAGCLRITVGSPGENMILLEALESYNV